ncbi:MAG: hypothetical protein HY273_07265 [Gammaproteobacteria bacterium]|nr:hypothetical protein [Gammaproteobacteria bacterium]
MFDSAQHLVAKGDIPASGGELALTVPPNTALHVTAAALDQENQPRFSGNKDVPPIASGATSTVSLILDALSPLSSLVQGAELGTLTVPDNTTDVAVITTNAKPDQRVSYSISGGADLNLFRIDVDSGQLSFNNPPRVGEYEVQVTFTDGFESVVQDLKVKVMAQSGGLDISFGTNGIVTKDFGNIEVPTSDSAKAVVVQSDGKIVVAGTTFNDSSSGSALVRYTKEGKLDDLTFGTKGIVLLDGEVNAMALQSDDSIVIAGTISNTAGNTDFLLMHFDKDGNIDTGFGGIEGGIVNTDIDSGSNDSAAALVIQADGKIVVVGDMDYARLALAGVTGTQFAVVRYDTKGNLDTTFGQKIPELPSTGIMITNITGSTDAHAAAVTLQGDTLQTSGKIVVAGHGTFQVVIGGVQSTDDDFVIVRYDNNGIPDDSFDTDGIVNTDFASDDQATGVVIQPDGTPEGKIVAAGSVVGAGLALARYNNNGTLDLSFGSSGKVANYNSISESVNALVLQPDGKLVVGGTFDYCRGDCIPTLFGAVRYNTNGSFDTSFGRVFGRVSQPSGEVFFDALNETLVATSDETHRIAGVKNGLGTAYALALQPDGKIVVVGDVYGTAPEDFGVVRFNP